MVANQPTKTCEHCGTSLHRGTRYCSRACYFNAQPQTIHERFWPKVQKTDGCWLWRGPLTRDGYGQFNAVRGKTTPNKPAHKVAWELTHGSVPIGVNVCHNCPGGDNPQCVNPAHLFLGTQAENVRDMDHKGRRRTGGAPGERNTNAKVTADVVRVIRGERARGVPLITLARRFGVTFSAISKIARRTTWAHVT